MKKSVRLNILKYRDQLSDLELDELSGLIWSNVKQIPGFMIAETVLVYASFNGEVRTDAIIKYLLNKDVRVLIPSIKKGYMTAKEIKLADELAKNKMGIRQPPEDRPDIDLSKIDCVILPGLAFDQTGHRIGFGAGYYDRFLKNVDAGTLLIGVAYDFQIIEKVDAQNYDIPVHCIATELDVIVCPRS